MTTTPTTPMRDDPRYAKATLLTDQQVAHLLGIGRRTVWTYVHLGELPHPIRLGRSTRWRLSDIENHLQRRTGDVNGREHEIAGVSAARPD